MEYDVVVIGAGAAGLMAAGTAAESGRRVLLLEKMEKAGRKIRITGKGRCNVTNMHPKEEFLRHVRWRERFFTPAYEAFDSRQTFDFFTALGVKLEVERGERVFPESGNAWEIADALAAWCEKSGVEIRYHSRVTGVEAADGQITGVTFVDDAPGRTDSRSASKINGSGGAPETASRKDGSVSSVPGRSGGSAESREENGNGAGLPEPRRVACRNVIICTGGVSYPATGSTGDGYGFAHDLGHPITEVRPSLVPLECRLPESRSLYGVHLRNVNVKLLVDHKIRGEEFGELEFTEWGVMGPTVLRLSRNAVDALIDGRRVTITIDLKPALTPEQLSARIAREVEALPRSAQANDLLRKLVPAGVSAAVAKKLHMNRRDPIRDFTQRKQEALAEYLKEFVLPVTDYRPFEEAIVTAGGVDVSELDAYTMQSRLVGGLYFAGEVLDIDADTGGYNLQIAFSTGRMAGRLLKKEDVWETSKRLHPVPENPGGLQSESAESPAAAPARPETVAENAAVELLPVEQPEASGNPEPVESPETDPAKVCSEAKKPAAGAAGRRKKPSEPQKSDTAAS